VKNSGYGAICIITLLATISVISGIKRGIRVMSYVAFFCGWLVMMICLYGDNTFYLLNIMVQTTGYYIQYVIQVGFDCEAFQQQAFEWTSQNKYWGSGGTESVLGKVTANGLEVATSSSDCGDQVNPCTQGIITMSAALATSTAPMAMATAAAALQAMKMPPSSISKMNNVANLMSQAYGSVPGIPCGSGWDTTNYDAFTQELMGSGVIGSPLCAGMTGASVSACASLWSGAFPTCPETTTKDTPNWGTCNAHKLSCPKTAAYFADTNPMFMDWWTIFYWAWWITWAPFVGFFVAKISRGRTVREVIIGGFVCPTVFAVIWFSVFGGLAIKMERTAEIALQVRPDLEHAGVTCTEHYSGGAPITPEAKKLAEAGYYMITCLPPTQQMYMLMNPYKNLTGFIQFFLWFGLVIYFVTSSDSGSMTDDIISAGGLSEHKIPIWQKIFWCWTEGIVAIALLSDGRASLSALRALSIVIGLPFTVLLCMAVPSLYRILKKEMGDEDIIKSKKFNTQLLDFMELFQPKCGSPCTPMQHVISIVTAMFLPFIPVKKSLDAIMPGDAILSIAVASVTQTLFFCFILFHALEPATLHMHTLGWVWHFFFCAIVAVVRQKMRQKYNVWGSFADDLFVAFFCYPITLAQCSMMAETDGKDAPDYFADADQVIEEMAGAGGPALPRKGEVEISRA